MNEHDHPDHIDKAKAKKDVDDDVKAHGNVPRGLPGSADRAA